MSKTHPCTGCGEPTPDHITIAGHRLPYHPECHAAAWAARLTQPVLPTAPEGHGPESQIEQLVAVKDEEAGLKAQPAV